MNLPFIICNSKGTDDLVWKGVTPPRQQKRITPKLHMSTWGVYSPLPFFLRISGATYIIVPQKVLIVELLISFERPKSVTFTRVSSSAVASKMFSG